MADTFTPNAGMILPDLGDVFNFATHVEANFTLLDGLLGDIPCTSSSRPSNTYPGQTIYETDTKRYAQNTGTKVAPVWTYLASAVPCTSGAHPSTSGISAGMTIYETDTKMSAIYTGSQYEYYAQQIAPTQVLGGTTASVTFSSIPAVRRLMVKWMAKGNSGTPQDLRLQIDSATSNYQMAKLVGRSAAASVTTAAGGLYVPAGVLPSSTTANYFGSGSIDIQAWASTSAFLTFSAISATYDTTTSYWTELYNGQYLVVGPHSSITLSPASGSFVAGSEFSLYALP